jgi:anion-transporting  ArsA/GET3 family ATPase
MLSVWRELMLHHKARVHVVIGKGGVGKTVVSSAMAMALAAEGQKVLLAEVNAHDRVAALLGAPPVGAHMREVLENLWVVDMNPTDSIHEYALMTIRFEAIYKAVFENKMIRSFIRFIPSLGEMVMLGKLWFHEQEQENGKPKYDAIIIDAPATGHGISMLRTPSSIEKIVPAGIMRDHARSMRLMLTDPKKTRLHIVTLPEEMPVNEARELEAAAKNVLNMAIGTTFINQHVPELPPDALSKLAQAKGQSVLEAANETLSIREAKRRAGIEHLERLPGRLLSDLFTINRIVGPGLSRQQISEIAQSMREARSKGASS